MTLLKVPLSLVRATVSGLKTADSGASAGNMAANTRQNVTWVEVCFSNHDTYIPRLTNRRVCEESLPSGSSSHICAEHGTTVSGLRATVKMPHHNYSSYRSCDYHGKDESA